MWLQMESRSVGREELTAQLACARGMVARWLFGDRAPSRTYATQIERFLGVPVAAWDEQPKKEFHPPVAA